jgi:dienelactone hydrolase
MTVKTQPIPYHDGETALTGVLVWDDARGEKRPGILVVHGGAGLDAHAKGRARHLAERGYVALACDMYGEGVAGDRDRVLACIAELRGDPERLCRRAQAGLTALAAQPQVDGRLAAVGYCFGGMTVLELARAGGALAGVVSIHGSLTTTRPARPGRVTARILVCHGAIDPHVPFTHVSAFVEEMNRVGADWQLIVYGGAMHGFTHEQAVGASAPGVAYHASADARSATAMAILFGELFGPEASDGQPR